MAAASIAGPSKEVNHILRRNTGALDRVSLEHVASHYCVAAGSQYHIDLEISQFHASGIPLAGCFCRRALRRSNRGGSQLQQSSSAP